VPLAEEIGAIIPIGYWTLRQVCERVRQWRAQGRALPVAVNLSASQFHEPRLVRELDAILGETGVPLAFLEIEITESMVMRDPDRAGEVMAALRARGVRLTIDDFGTGHSSLGYLKRFPIDRLKVDRTFVRDLPHNGEDIAITRAVIAMAHSLGMSVVAEGVEHRAQFDLLRAEGCDEFQGYYCTPPLDEGELLRFLEECVKEDLFSARAPTLWAGVSETCGGFRPERVPRLHFRGGRGSRARRLASRIAGGLFRVLPRPRALSGTSRLTSHMDSFASSDGKSPSLELFDPCYPGVRKAMAKELVSWHLRWRCGKTILPAP
jgi:EAL domain-containing protein (putative c-di-GMP-specific phosphodiesterase class I)